MRALRQGSNLLPGFHRDPLARRQFAPGFVATFRLVALVAGRSIPDLTASKDEKGFSGEKNGARVSHCVYLTKELAPHCSENCAEEEKGPEKAFRRKPAGAIALYL